MIRIQARSSRRVNPSLWDVDYCLLRGLRIEVESFSRSHAASGMTIVDLGCGAKPYRPLFPSDCTYVGVDSSESTDTDIVVKPGAPLPIATGTVDLILSTQVLYKVKDVRFFLSECHRILKPSGRILLTTHGTWTHHPATGGDYFRFTHQGLKHFLEDAGFKPLTMTPVVGTLGTGLHLRQLLFNAWLRRARLSALAPFLNIWTNLRIMAEDAVTPEGSRLSSPVILSCIASPLSITSDV